MNRIIIIVLTSITLSLVCWKIIDFVLFPIDFWQYLFIEFLLLLGHKVFKFVHRMLTPHSN
jgi:signal transduction histidine kinase